MNKTLAFFVTHIQSQSVGLVLSTIGLQINAAKSSLPPGRFFLDKSEGASLRLDEFSCDHRLGTVERVCEEALGQFHFVVSDPNKINYCIPPFWLLPNENVSTSTGRVMIDLEIRNLFMTSEFQMACWNRFVWGSMFFDDPATPPQHVSIALNTPVNIGHSMPISVGDRVPGVLTIEKRATGSKFFATIHLLNNSEGLKPGYELYSRSMMHCEGIEASFECKIGEIIDVLTSEGLTRVHGS